MNLPKAFSILTIALICILPLAVTTGCTGPPNGTGTNTTGILGNTTQTSEIDGPDFPDAGSSDADSNTIN